MQQSDWPACREAVPTNDAVQVDLGPLREEAFHSPLLVDIIRLRRWKMGFFSNIGMHSTVPYEFDFTFPKWPPPQRFRFYTRCPREHIWVRRKGKRRCWLPVWFAAILEIRLPRALRVTEARIALFFFFLDTSSLDLFALLHILTRSCLSVGMLTALIQRRWFPTWKLRSKKEDHVIWIYS